MRRFYILSLFFWVLLPLGCKQQEKPEETDFVIDIDTLEAVNQTACGLTVDPESLVNGDQLPIVAGKLLSYAVSTADECAYMPPGKWINVYGTVYYRYIERGSGENKVSVNGLVKQNAEIAATILSQDQMDQIVSILPQQLEWENEARFNRDLIARELYQWKSGAVGDENLILGLTHENGSLLKNLVHQRTSVFAAIVNDLTASQIEGFCRSRTAENDTIDPEDLKNIKNQLSSEDEKTTLNLVLSKFFVWATGTESMNQLVDDGRPGVYFGFANLRIEDRSGEEVSSGLRKEASDLIMETLNAEQSSTLNNLVAAQQGYLSAYYSTRAELASALVGYLTDATTTPSEGLLALCIQSEEAETRLGLLQAKEMGRILQSMDPEQMQILVDFKAGN